MGEAGLAVGLGPGRIDQETTIRETQRRVGRAAGRLCCLRKNKRGLPSIGGVCRTRRRERHCA